GAIEELEDVVLVAVAMGGESTHPRQSIKANSLIHLHLRLRCRRIEPAGRSRRVFTSISGAPGALQKTSGDCENGPRRLVRLGLHRVVHEPGASSAAILEATEGSRKLSVPTATSVAPASSRSRACAALWTPPI